MPEPLGQQAMTDEQRRLARLWYSLGLLDRPDVWPFTKAKPPRRKTKPVDLSRFEKAIV